MYSLPESFVDINQTPLETSLLALESGLWPVVISPPDATWTPSPGKAPIGKGWGLERPTRESLIATYERYPTAGTGLKLGADGWVIDADIDDPDAAAPVLERLFPGGIPPTFGWENADGRFHCLFSWDDRLAALGKPIVKGGEHYPGLEIRIGAPPGDPRQYQSVIPPSRMRNGEPRRWNGRGVILPLPESVISDLTVHVGIGPTLSIRPPRPDPTWSKITPAVRHGDVASETAAMIARFPVPVPGSRWFEMRRVVASLVSQRHSPEFIREVHDRWHDHWHRLGVALTDISEARPEFERCLQTTLGSKTFATSWDADDHRMAVSRITLTDEQSRLIDQLTRTAVRPVDSQCYSNTTKVRK